MNAKVKKIGLIVAAGIGGIMLLKGGSNSGDGWSGGSGSGGGSEEDEEKPEVYKKGRDEGSKQTSEKRGFIANVINDVMPKKTNSHATPTYAKPVIPERQKKGRTRPASDYELKWIPEIGAWR